MEPSFPEEFYIEEVKRAFHDHDGYLLKIQVLDVETNNRKALQRVLREVENIYTSIIKKRMALDETVTLLISVHSRYPRTSHFRLDKKTSVCGNQRSRCGG